MTIQSPTSGPETDAELIAIARKAMHWDQPELDRAIADLEAGNGSFYQLHRWAIVKAGVRTALASRSLNQEAGTPSGDATLVFEDKLNPGDWRHERYDDDGGCEVTIFCGPRAKERAEALAAADAGAILRELVEAYNADTKSSWSAIFVRREAAWARARAWVEEQGK